MNNFKRICLSAAAIGLLGGCSYQSFSEVDALNEAQAVGSPFTQRLATEYREFSNTELKEMFDYPDALHFARKGLAAASGKSVLPEPVADWNLSPEHIKELGTARGRLINVLDMGSRETMPDESAVAQARFDCWIEQQEENWNDGDAVKCKGEFEAALRSIEDRTNTTAAPAEPPTIQVDESAPMEIENAMYLVFFDFDKSVVTSEGMSILDAVAEEVSKRQDVMTLNVIGHTDTSGPKTYNQKLAMRRANAVMDALVQRGVDAGKIRVESRGEDDLIVQTADGIREPANRRVSISFGQ